MANDPRDPLYHSQLGTELPMDFDLMRKIANGLVDLAISKDTAYGSSWCRRGGQGAYMTFVRKPDRLEAQMQKAGYNVFDVSVAPEDGESIDETLRDLINYSLLILVKRELVRRKLTQRSMTVKEIAEQLHNPLYQSNSGQSDGLRESNLNEGFEAEGSAPTPGYVDQDRGRQF